MASMKEILRPSCFVEWLKMGNHSGHSRNHSGLGRDVADGALHGPYGLSGPVPSSGDLIGSSPSGPRQSGPRFRLFCDAMGHNCEGSDEWGGPARQRIEQRSQPMLQSLPEDLLALRLLDPMSTLRGLCQSRSWKRKMLLEFM